MTYNEDALLDLTAEQYEKYLSVLSLSEKETVSIALPEADELPPPVSADGVKSLLLSLSAEAVKLLPKEEEKVSFLSFSEPSVKEKEEYMEQYYSVINTVSRISAELSALFPVLRAEREHLNGAHLQRIRVYHAYLPYKLALNGKDEYKDELFRLEKELSDGLEESRRLLNGADTALDVIMLVCESVIPELFAKSGEATGAPPYPNLSKKRVFECVRAFCAQINAQIHRLPV